MYVCIYVCIDVVRYVRTYVMLLHDALHSRAPNFQGFIYEPTVRSFQFNFVQNSSRDHPFYEQLQLLRTIIRDAIRAILYNC